MKKILLFLLFLVLIPGISAQTIENYNLEIHLFASGLATEKISFDIISNEDVNYVEYKLTSIPENIQSNYEYEIVKEEEYVIIIYKDIKANKITNVEFEFDIKKFIEVSDSKNIFSFQYSPDLDVKNFNFILTLPEGFILSEIESPISPTPKGVTTNGRNIIIDWQFTDIDDVLPFIVVYEKGSYKGNNLFTIPIIVLIALIIFIIFFYRRQKKKFVMGTLSGDEKQIFDIILREKQVTQKKIVDETKFNKIKVSKILRRLEEKEIIEKKPYMKTNIIKINKKIKI